MPVGLFEAAPYAADRVAMQPGDTLVLYSDGVTEAHNVAGEEFGEARMVDVLKRAHQEPAAAILDRLVADVRTFAHGAEQYDDVTAVIVKYTG
jgi:sigma-B regulation protein RsbU (phosphoserine phosphatase)